jgi:hypothetical protein
LVTQWFPDAEARLVADPESGSAAAPGEGIARFRDPGDRGQATAPSLALIKEPRDIGPLPTTWRTRAIFRVELVDSAGRMHRPERALEAILLLDGGRRVRASGRDGKPLTIPLPPL